MLSQEDEEIMETRWVFISAHLKLEFIQLDTAKWNSPDELVSCNFVHDEQ